MSSPQNAIVIDDNEDPRSFPDSERPRFASLTSSASSTTLRAESSEPNVIPNLDRLSTAERLGIQSEAHPSRPNTSAQQEQSSKRRQSSTESDNGNGRRLSDNGASSHHGKRRATDIDRVIQDLFEIEENEVELHNLEGRRHEVINVDDIEAIEAKVEEDIVQEERYPQYRKHQNAALRNPSILLPSVKIESLKCNQDFLRAGKTVELKDGNFLKIKAIVKNLSTDEVFLRGWLLKRTNRLFGIFPRKFNEVCFILEKDLDDSREIWEQSILELEIKDVEKVRHLRCTNRPFPECRFEKDQLPHNNNAENIRHVVENEVLVCRWMITTDFDNAQVRLGHAIKPNNYLSTQIEPLSDDKCSPGCVNALSAEMRRFLWRGKSSLGGSYQQPWGAYAYSYADAFSGCGGVMRGASRAGLKPMYAVDNDPIPCATLKKNFPDVEVYEMGVGEFVSLPDPEGNFKCDVVHSSPVCCYYSSVNTGKYQRILAGKGQKDEANEVVLFIVEDLLKKFRPRIFTMEQTDALLFLRYRYHFDKLLRMFIDNGYSVRYDRLRFQELGLPQKRERLIIIAACPGETIPRFPSLTHSENGAKRLKPLTAPRGVLQRIPHNAKNHDIASARGRGNYMGWDDLKISQCITCDGGANKDHPSGERTLTPRESAALQGFDHRFEFLGTRTQIRKQIGNAFPPSIAKIFFDGIRKHLEKVDAAEKKRGVKH